MIGHTLKIVFFFQSDEIDLKNKFEIIVCSVLKFLFFSKVWRIWETYEDDFDEMWMKKYWKKVDIDRNRELG